MYLQSSWETGRLGESFVHLHFSLVSWCSQQSLFQFLTFNFTQVSATKLLSFKIYTHSINSSTFFSLLNAICFESLHFTGKFRQVPHMSVSLVIFVFLRLFAHWNEIVYTFSSVNLRFSDKYVTGSNQISPPPPFPVVKVYTHSKERETGPPSDDVGRPPTKWNCFL